MTTCGNTVNVPVPGSARFEWDTAMAIGRIKESLGPRSTPGFAGATFTGLTANALVYADTSKALKSVTLGSSLSFSAGALNTIQGIRTADSPTFAGLTLTGMSGVVKATAGVLAGGGAHSDLAGVTADQHHNQAHVLDGADHTVSGLTAGHVLQALTPTTFGFGVVPGSHDEVTLGTANGLSLAGQVLSLPTTATPTFSTLVLTSTSNALDAGGWTGRPDPIGGHSNVYGDLFCGNTGENVGRLRLGSTSSNGFIQWNRYNTGSSSQQIDTAKPSFSFSLNGSSDAYLFQRSPAGSTTMVTLMTLAGATGLLTNVGSIRTNDVFNCNGTGGVTQAASAGKVNDVTALAGGIATAQTQITYAANGEYTLAGITSITITNGRITAIA